MDKDSTHSTASFQIAPGFLLVEILEDTNLFKPADSKPDDSQTRKGTVLAIGSKYLNDFGVMKEPPPVKVSDQIAFRWQYNQDELEIDFKKYPLVAFSDYRGTL